MPKLCKVCGEPAGPEPRYGRFCHKCKRERGRELNIIRRNRAIEFQGDSIGSVPDEEIGPRIAYARKMKAERCGGSILDIWKDYGATD